MPLLSLTVIGFFIGLVIITLGGGGGGFYVGVLTALFNVPPAIAASTSLATIIPTTTVGMIGHWKAGNVNFKLGSIMMVSAIIGAILGSLCSDFVPEKYYNKITGILLLVLGIQMVVGLLKNRKKENKQEKRPYKKSDFIKAVFYGILGGSLSGLVGISGTTPIVAGLMALGCNVLEVVGTSVFVLVGISTVGFLIHLGLGNVNWKLVFLLILGTSTGALLAPYILSKLNRNTVEKVLPPLIIVLTLTMGVIVVLK